MARDPRTLPYPNTRLKKPVRPYAETFSAVGVVKSIVSKRQHAWHMRFDRVCCRDCDAVQGVDDDAPCPGTRKIRPRATAVRQQEGRA